MKTIGMIGGMSWESTAVYYRLLNQSIRRRLGGHHSARIVLSSIDFAPIVDAQQAGAWQSMGEQLADEARRLQRAGADLIILATNTMHKVAEQIEGATDLPFLHIADATAARIRQLGLQRIGFMGTRYAMEQDFYTGRLRDRHAIDSLLPDATQRDCLHRVIFDELCQGQIRAESRQQFQAISRDLQQAGAQAIVAGCTEIGLLLRARDIDLPLLDTSEIHAEAAVDLALSSDG